MTANFYNFLRQEQQRLTSDLVIKIPQGYQVFGHYELKTINDGVTVKKHDQDIKQFSSVKSALAWCTLDKFGQWTLAATLEKLDSDLQRITNELTVNKCQIQTHKDNREILMTKMYTKISVLCHIKNQMKKSIDHAKYLQTKGFNYET